MKIAVLSGKGGTGKTFVSVNLACATGKSAYIDCDVEEPNGHLFLKPDITDRLPVSVTVPQIDANKCTGCRKCVDFCKYNALALIKDKLMIFYEVCHSCGGCILFCPEKAFTEKEREIGTIEEGASGEVAVLTGCLNTGEVSGVPIIKGLMEKLPEQGTVVIDCPPGSACVVMESIREADFCILVAEPTLFGVHNLAMVYDLVKLFNKPFGVVLNKCLPEENPAEQFCVDHKIKVLAKIPFNEELGKLNSQGLIAVRENRQYRELFQRLLKTLEKEAVS
ncbi:ATP-binding protein [Dehalobacterium formicoaceticum]|uniref:ATP-binding protein n=1 Tax=Dehalobacterium formicoaceticum TaxID=51515 RepID=UPI0031F6A708